MSIARTFPAFSVTFAVVYAASVQFNFALFTYFPVLETFRLGGAIATRDTGPAMYWYGWMATAAIAGIIVAGVAALAPESWGKKLWPVLSWAVPLAAMAYATYLARDWFI